MVVGHHKGEVLGACTDCRRLWAKYRAGEIDDNEIEAVNGRLAPSVGTCMVMGTASTMACITEALGPVAADERDHSRAACRALSLGGGEAAGGRRHGQGEGPKPSEFLTASSFRNAQVVLQAIGGSTNGLIISPRSPPHQETGSTSTPSTSSAAKVPGADRPQAVGRALHGAFPSRRRRAETVEATRRSH
jgi:hypothetical protein